MGTFEFVQPGFLAGAHLQLSLFLKEKAKKLRDNFNIPQQMIQQI
jgi:hypothetical protein